MIRQRDALLDIIKYSEGTEKQEWDQVGIAKDCCRAWKIPFQ